MSGSEIIDVISVILLSSIKLVLVGIPVAFALGFGYLKIVVTTSIGGILGVIAFTYFSDGIALLWKKIFPVKKKKKIFSKTNRRIVKVRMSYGIYGIALLTPPLLSIPVGTVICNSLVKSKRKLFLILFTSVLFWSLLISAVKLIFPDWSFDSWMKDELI